MIDLMVARDGVAGGFMLFFGSPAREFQYAYRMPASNPTPELFEIEATSAEADDPENETFVIRVRVEGMYEVRSFLSDNRVDERRIAFAIEELGRSRRVRVRNKIKARAA